MSQAKHWCFTYNNYNPNAIPDTLPDGSVYLIFGKEVAETGTPHLQGFISYSKPRRLNQVRAFLPLAHWTVARNLSGSIEYCKKEGDFTEIGERPSSTCPKSVGKRTELTAFMQSVREGLHDGYKLREAHPNVFARYGRFADKYLRDHLPKPEIPVYDLRPWQHRVQLILSGPAHPRQILFCVDQAGASGKSWYARHLRKTQGALILSAGKKADLAYAFSKVLPHPSIVILDIPRSKMESLHFDFLEELKNGLLFSSKYESDYLEFPVPHVVVMCNEHPDMTKLTSDRYVIIDAELH